MSEGNWVEGLVNAEIHKLRVEVERQFFELERLRAALRFISIYEGPDKLETIKLAARDSLDPPPLPEVKND